MMNEIFKQILRFKDYEISNLGSVKSFKHKQVKILKPGINKNGCRRAVLYRNGNIYIKDIAYLVLLTFIGPCPKGKEVSHLNGNPLNDTLENLKWETHEENQYRKIEYDVYLKGKKSGRAKLKNKDIFQVKELLKQGFAQRKIAMKFNVSEYAINKVKNNRPWIHI